MTNSKKQKYVKLNDDIWKALKIMAAKKETTMVDLASKYILEGIKKEENNEN
jgi:hypothetical protein